MLRQLLGDSLRVLALTVHPQCYRRQPRIQHPALIGLQDVAQQRAHSGERLNQFGIRGQNGSGRVLIETPANPTLVMTDIAQAAAACCATRSALCFGR